VVLWVLGHLVVSLYLVWDNFWFLIGINAFKSFGVLRFCDFWGFGDFNGFGNFSYF